MHHNSVELINAFTPNNPKEELSALTPLAVLIGEKDEVYNPIKMTSFIQKSQASPATTHIKTFENETHFSILIKANDFIGEWIEAKISN